MDIALENLRQELRVVTEEFNREQDPTVKQALVEHISHLWTEINEIIKAKKASEADKQNQVQTHK